MMPILCMLCIFGPVFARHEIKFNRLAECSSRDNTHSAYHNEKPKITLKYYCTAGSMSYNNSGTPMATTAAEALSASTLASAQVHIHASITTKYDFCSYVKLLCDNYKSDTSIRLNHLTTLLATQILCQSHRVDIVLLRVVRVLRVFHSFWCFGIS